MSRVFVLKFRKSSKVVDIIVILSVDAIINNVRYDTHIRENYCTVSVE